MHENREVFTKQVALQGPLESKRPEVIAVSALKSGATETISKVNIERQRLVEVKCKRWLGSGVESRAA